MKEVWILQTSHKGSVAAAEAMPYLVYASREDMLLDNPAVKWDLVDSDVCEGYLLVNGKAHIFYYATPWPVDSF